MYLFFDTETSGLPKNWNAHVHELDNWPRMVQIAWAHYDEYKNLLAEHCYIIYPEGFAIPEEASKINRITTERAIKEGTSLEYVLAMFALTLVKVEKIIAHNLTFDKAIIGSELIRDERSEAYARIKKLDWHCTMKTTSKFCDKQFPDGTRGKWPKLSELFEVLNPGENLCEDLHDAKADMRVLADCFFKLEDLKVDTKLKKTSPLI